MQKFFCLIDTNIFIQLEDSRIVGSAFTKFHRLCNKNSVKILIHPLSKEDIEKDKNKNRKEHSLSKIPKYQVLEEPPIAEKDSLETLFGKIRNHRDEIDCQLLYALKKHAVSFLITEDRKIHKRVKKLPLKDSVLTVNQANHTFDQLFREPIEVSFPKINNTYLYNINYEDKIFNSLKVDYLEFQNWWERCSEAQVKAWVVGSSQELESICIYKEAKSEDYNKYNLIKKSLKLATFKVDESYTGKKLGELMLKQAFLYCVENKFSSCWMTVFPKHEILIDLIKDFGFDEIGKTNLIDNKTNKKELVFQKKFVSPDDSRLSGLDYHIKYSPFYDDKNDIEKYIIPIQEKYYHILFPEQKTQLSLPGIDNEIPGNTIKKVYLCHAPAKQLKPNDLIFFYVSRPVQAVTSIGIIESVFRSNELHKVISHIGKRSVYSYSEIENMTRRNVLVIAFRFIKHLEQEIPLNFLKKQKVIKGPPQSVQKLKNYKKLKHILLRIKKSKK